MANHWFTARLVTYEFIISDDSGEGKKIIRKSPSVTVSFDTEEATCGWLGVCHTDG